MQEAGAANDFEAFAGQGEVAHVEVSGRDAEMVLRLVEAHQERLSNLISNPKGMTHGDVQRDLTACTHILGGQE